MIAYIEEEIKVQMDEIDIRLLQEVGINFVPSDEYILIAPQKITLNEFRMNEVFANIFIDCDIEYGNYGSEGCDFSIIISDKRQND